MYRTPISHDSYLRILSARGMLPHRYVLIICLFEILLLTFVCVNILGNVGGDCNTLLPSFILSP